MKAARAIPLVVLLVAVASAGGWFAVRRDARPNAKAGRTWLDGFATSITSPGLLGARRPGALALFPRLGSWPVTGCQAEWRKDNGLGPVIVSQSVELARLESDPCDQAQLRQLGAVLRQSEGVTPGVLVEQFGIHQVHRDTGLNRLIIYEWDVLYGIYIRMKEPAQLAGPDTFSVMVTRFLGASGVLPSPVAAERWLHRIVALLTGPDQPAADGAQAVRLVDAAMLPQAARGGDCATSYSTSGAAPKKASG